MVDFSYNPDVDPDAIDSFLEKLKDEAPAAHAVVEIERDKAADGEAKRARKYHEREAALAKAREFAANIAHLNRQLANGTKEGTADRKNRALWAKSEAHHRAIAKELSERKIDSFSAWPSIEKFATFIMRPTIPRRFVKFIPKLGKASADPAKAAKELAACTETLAYFRDQARHTEIARLPIEEARAEVMRKIGQAAAKARPDVSRAFRFQRVGESGQRIPGVFEWPESSANGMDAAWQVVSWLFPDVMKARFEEELAAHASDSALPSKGRREKLAEINSHITATEYDVGALLLVMEKTGVFVDRSRLSVPAALQIEAIYSDTDPLDFG